MRFTFLSLIAILFLSSCEKETPKVLDVGLKKVDNEYTLTYQPEMYFRAIPEDSVTVYLTKGDMLKLLSTKILIGEKLLQTDEFSLFAMAYENFSKGKKRHQVFLRTFDKDMKQINDLNLGSTIDKPEFEGYVNPDATIVRTSVNGKTDKYSIATNGTFQFVERIDE